MEKGIKLGSVFQKCENIEKWYRPVEKAKWRVITNKMIQVSGNERIW